MPATAFVKRGARVHFGPGDSNTVRQWENPGWFYLDPRVPTVADTCNSNWCQNPVVTHGAGARFAVNNAGAQLSRAQGAAAPADQVVVTASGVSGNILNNVILDGIGPRFNNYSFDVAIMFIGLNDCGPVQVTPPATFLAQGRTILTAVRTNNPTGQIVWPEVFCSGTQWDRDASGVPRWGINQFDANILAINGVIAQLCSEFGYVLAPQRQRLLDWLVANGPEGGAATGLVTPNGDAIHLWTPGHLIMRENIYRALTF